MDLFARTVAVLLPIPLDGPFHYRIEGDVPPAGTLVEVPFGRRLEIGVVWPDPAPMPPGTKLKDVGRRLDAPPLPESVLALVDDVARATVQPRGAVLKLVLSTPSALAPPPGKLGWCLAAAAMGSTPARQRVVEAADAIPRTTGDLAKRAGVSAAVVRAAAAAGLLAPATISETPLRQPDPSHPGPDLSDAQHAAAEALNRAVAGEGFHGFLLFGVPGSGKTEVYLEALATALRAGRQVLVIVPEIALTAQWLARFAERFGAPPVVWHSHLTAAQRRRHWRAVLTGEARVVIGARSAVFLPLADLGLIIVDEEHDQSFKQDDGVPYHAREVARLRAERSACTLVLASATPALESQVAAGLAPGSADPRFSLLELPERHGGAALPEVSVVDLLRERPARGRWLAAPLIAAAREAFDRGEQVLLFLNRRGYAPLLICRACGHRLSCPNCSTWLVWHRLRRRLLCHHCGYSPPEPEHCGECGAVDSFAAAGPGVERVAEEAAELFPEQRLALLTSDTMGSPANWAATVEAITRGDVDLVIGTQVLAKGHHFPNLTLVGVVDADVGVLGGDLRASERTFQLLYQVAGRAGREALQGQRGRVLIQSTSPDHPALQALVATDSRAFYAQEASERAAMGLPPFGQLAAIVVSAGTYERAEGCARELVRTAPPDPTICILGPAAAPLSLLRGRHRVRLLVQASQQTDLPDYLRNWLGAHKLKGDLRLQIDVDPQSFF